MNKGITLLLHTMISTNIIRCLYTKGDATKEEYTRALLAYQEYLEDVRSEQRDLAAAYDDRYKY